MTRTLHTPVVHGDTGAWITEVPTTDAINQVRCPECDAAFDENDPAVPWKMTTFYGAPMETPDTCPVCALATLTFYLN